MNNLATRKKDDLTEEAVASLQSDLAAPTYKANEKYASLSQSLLDSILNAEDFSYDMNSDALYNQYKKMYSEQGRRAAEHVYGLNTSLTGGYGNSYASSAASAAYGDYMSALSEKAAELESRAYERYKDKDTALRENLKTVNSLLENDYDKYRDSVSDYYKNEELAISKENQELKKEQLADSRRNDEISLAFKAAESGDYSLLSALGIDPSSMKNDREFADALKKAELGDYSGLHELGINTESLEYKNSLDIAQTLAEYGDFSGLDALGIDTTSLLNAQVLAEALQRAEFGDYSMLNMLGYNTSSVEYDKSLARALELVEVGDYSGLEALGIDTSYLVYAQTLENAKTLASYGDYSGLAALGFDVSSKEEQATLERALAFAKLGDYSLLERLGFTPPGNEPEEEKISINIQNGAQSAFEAGGMAGLEKYLDNQIAYGQLSEAGKQTILNAYTKK